MNRQEYEDGIRELYNGIGKAKMSPYKDPRFQGYMKQIEDLGFDMTRPAVRNMATTMFIVIDMGERENKHIYKDVLLVFETIRSEGKTSSAKCFSVLR